MRLDRIMVFLEKCYAEMAFAEAGMGFDRLSAEQTIMSACSSGGCFFVEETGGEVVGVFAAMVVPNIMDYSQRRAVEYIWHSAPGMPKKRRYRTMIDLLAQGEKWAESINAYLVVSTSAERPAVARILDRRNYTKLETSFGKGWCQNGT